MGTGMGKVVLITGASSGFGEACAKKFAEQGYALILGARRLEKLEQLRSRLSNSNAPSVRVFKLDVTDAASIDDLLAKLGSSLIDIDVLINSAGLALGLEPAHEVNLSDWEAMVDTNIMGLLRMTRAILPGMVTKNAGHIINLGSVAGAWPYPGGNAYGGTKAFVKNFSQALRADVLGKNIRVTSIEPGMAKTNFSNIRFKGDIEAASQVYEGVQPLTAADIADIIYWVTAVPAHVNINSLEVMPVCQAWGPLAVSRDRGEDLVT
jgi:3-hydroxy acid dehydrogenase/malonic semialdehyde reductase